MKSAIYIEQPVKTAKEPSYWAGYLYAKDIAPDQHLSFIKDAFDQWGNPVKVYQLDHHENLETPGGMMSSNLVVLFANLPAGFSRPYQP